MSDRNWKSWIDRVGFEDANGGFVTMSDAGVKRLRKVNDGTLSNRASVYLGVTPGDIVEVTVRGRLLEGDPDSETCPRIGIDYPSTGDLQTDVKITSKHWRSYQLTYVVPDTAVLDATVTISVGVWTDLIGDVEFAAPRVRILNEDSYKSLGLGVDSSPIYEFKNALDYIRPAGFTALLSNDSFGLPEPGNYHHYTVLARRAANGATPVLAMPYRKNAIYYGVINIDGDAPVWSQIVLGQDTGWITPTLENGWIDYSGGDYHTIAYRRDALGYVHIKGLGRAPDEPYNSVIFTLPPGFRPQHQLVFSTYRDPISAGSYDTSMRVDVKTDGTVAVGNGYQTPDVSLSWVTLSTISPFIAEA